MSPKRNLKRAFTLIELLVVIAIIGVLVALLVPAIQKVRAAAANTQCVNNLKQIGVAIHAYHDVNKCFPEGPGRQWNEPYFEISDRGWMFQILPYVEQDAVYKQGLKASDIFVGDLNDDFATSIIPPYVCPADPRQNAGSAGHVSSSAVRPLGYTERPSKYARTSYLGVLGKEFPTTAIANNNIDFGNGVFGGSGAKIRFDHVSDGASNTVMVGERPPSPDDPFSGFYWGVWASAIGVGDNTLWAITEPSTLLFEFVSDTSGYGGTGSPCPDRAYFSPGDLINYCHTNHFWSFHNGGGNWLLCDGSVRFMNYSAGTDVIPAMASITGGEVIPAID